MRPTVVGGLPKGRPGLGKTARRVVAPLLSETPANGWRSGAPGDRPTDTDPQDRSTPHLVPTSFLPTAPHPHKKHPLFDPEGPPEGRPGGVRRRAVSASLIAQ